MWKRTKGKMEPVTIYGIIALSFALSTLYSIHLRAIQGAKNYWKLATGGSATWLLTSFVLFPFMLFFISLSFDGFFEGYKSGILENEESDS